MHNKMSIYYKYIYIENMPRVFEQMLVLNILFIFT